MKITVRLELQKNLINFILFFFFQPDITNYEIRVIKKKKKKKSKKEKIEKKVKKKVSIYVNLFIF